MLNRHSDERTRSEDAESEGRGGGGDTGALPKVPALDFSSFADPVEPTAGEKPKSGPALDFSFRSDPVEKPAAVPLPAQLEGRGQPRAEVQMPRARPAATSTQPETISLPQPRPDIGPNPAGPGDVNMLDDVPFSQRQGYLGGGLLGDTGALSPEQAQAEREARIGAAKAVEDKATATRKKMQTDFGPELERLNMARKSLNLPPLTAEQVQNHAIGAAVEGEGKAAARTREARNEPLPTMTAPRAAGERVAKAIAGSVISIPSYLYEASQYAGRIMGASEQELKDDKLAVAVKNAADYSKKATEAALPGDVARDKDFWTAQVSQGFGSSVGFMAGGVAGKVLGFSNRATGALVAAMGAAQQGDQGLEEFDKAVERLGDNLGKEDVRAWRRLAVFITNSGLGATEAIPIANALERINSLTGGLVTRVAVNASIQSLEEMTQEIGQQIGQNTVAKLLYDHQRDIFQGVPDAAMVAGVLGFFQGGGIHAVGELAGLRDARAPVQYRDLPTPEEIMRQAREMPAAPASDVPMPPERPQSAAPAAAAPAVRDPAAAPQAGSAGQPAATASAVSAIERRVLRKTGHSDEIIDNMSRPDVAAKVLRPIEQEVEPELEPAAAAVPALNLRDDHLADGPVTREAYRLPGGQLDQILDDGKRDGALTVRRSIASEARGPETQSRGVPRAAQIEDNGDYGEVQSVRPDEFRLTRQADARKQQIADAVRNAIRQVAGRSAAARAEISDRVTASRPNEDWGSALNSDGLIGVYSPASDLIKVALADNSDPISTGYHEGWHAIEGTLTSDEVAILRRETDRLRKYVSSRVPELSEAIKRAASEEVWAEAAAQYAVARRHGKPIKGIHIAARQVFEKISEILARIRSALNGMGFRAAEDIFETFAGGQMADRRRGLPPDMRRRWWKKDGDAASIRRRAPRDGDPIPAPETVAGAWDPSIPFRQRLSDAFDAMVLKPSRALWDRQIDLLRFQKASEAMGRRVGENLDVYLAASLYPGRAGEQMKDAVKELWEPVYTALKERSLGREELHGYLYARHAPERNAKIREIDPDNDVGSGMTDEEAAEIIRGIGDRKGDFEAVAALIDKIVAANRAVMLRSGLESERTLANWEGAYKHYVPLKGFEAGTDDEIFGSPSSGRGFDVRRPESMRALGRFDRADDILTNLLDQTQRTIIRAEKNRVAKTFLRFAQANPSPFYKIGLAEKKRRIDPLTGLVEEYWANLPTHLDRMFAAKVGGKTYYIEIKHEGLLEALKTVGGAKINPLFELVGRLTREYSRFQTAKNPEFVFTNILRDIQDAGFTVTGEQRERYTRRFYANLLNGRALFGAVLGTANKGENTQYRRWFEEWREAGGKISHYGLKDLEELRGEVERELAQRAESTGKSVAMAPLRMINPINGKLVKFLEALSDVTESTTRLAVYIAGRETGFTKAQAARMSRNATVDFNRRGKHGAAINSLYAFANANIQGNIRLLRTLRKSKVARRAAFGIVVAGMLMTYWNMSVSPEDEEKKRAYEKRKYWERERNIIIYWPGAETAAKIPLGYGLNVFWMMGEQLAMRMMGKVSSVEAIGNVLGTMVDAFNPTGSQGSFFDLMTWLRGGTPTVLRWLPELATNRNWAGNRIHPDAMPWTEGLPNSSQNKAFTHPVAIMAAELANRLTGGNRFEPGWLDPYPDDLEYGWNFAVGGLGRFIANTSGTIADYVDGVDRPVERIPFVRRFVVSDNSPSIQSGAYYDKRREEQVKARRLRSAIKARGTERDDGTADEVIERLASELSARPGRNGRGIRVPSEVVFREADKQIKVLRQQEDAIRKDPKISRSERENQIRALREQMRGVMSNARRATQRNPQ